MKLMKLNIQLFGTVIKEIAPNYRSTLADFRPVGIISYTQNTPNNSDTYRMDLYGQLLDASAAINAAQYNFTTNVCGQTQPWTGQIDTTYISSGQKVYIGYQEFTVSHQDNGQANQQVFQIGGACNLYLPADGWTGWQAFLVSEIWPHTAPTIPRVSTITSNADNSTNKKDFGIQVGFTIARYSDSFTHTLEFVSGGTTYTIGTGLTTSGSYTFPISLIPNYPSSGSPTVTVTCKTYNGSTLIGSSTATVYLNVPSSYVPTCSLAIDDDNAITKAWGIWVKSRSILKGLITAEGIANSTISSYLSTFDSSSFNTNSFSKSIATSEELTVTSTVTDSRGRPATDSEVITVVDYAVPTITSAVIKRCLIDGTLNDFGTYGKVVCAYAISPCNDGEQDHNAKSLKVSLGATTKTFSLENYSGVYTATNLFENVEITGTYNFSFELSDSFETTQQTSQVIPSYTLYSLRAGGKGFTFGRVATEDGLHDYLGATFHNGLDANAIKYNGDELLNLLFPIGRGFIDHTDTDYSNYLGFTWVKTLVGMTPVGKDTTQTEFDTLGETGGTKTLTHNHGLQGTGAAQIGSPAGNANALGFRNSQVGDLSGSTYSPGNTALSYAGGHPNRSHNTDLTGTTNNTTTTNLQPYQVVNFWKRTA